MMRIPQMAALVLMIGLAAAVQGSEPVTCPQGIIPKDKLAEFRALRDRYFDACLTCAGNACRFRTFSMEQSAFARQCPVLFCTPVKLNRAAITPEDAWDEGTFHFTYRIDEYGRMGDFEITSIEGKMPGKTVLQLLRNTFKPRRFEPIRHEGQA